MNLKRAMERNSVSMSMSVVEICTTAMKRPHAKTSTALLTAPVMKGYTETAPFAKSVRPDVFLTYSTNISAGRILVLSTQARNNTPLSISDAGESSKLGFAYLNSAAYGSCSILWKDQLYVYGGTGDAGI